MCVSQAPEGTNELVFRVAMMTGVQQVLVIPVSSGRSCALSTVGCDKRRILHGESALDSIYLHGELGNESSPGWVDKEIDPMGEPWTQLRPGTWNHTKLVKNAG